ncbi:Helicase c2 [Candidatus Magnetoovum chiemensis]|nr:Helicase c2 [Candidatus Magnetoovum chiemensis]
MKKINIKKEDSFFNTLLENKLPAYEFRQEQDSMHKSVLSALNANKHLIVEAGTGVGKSLAYLVASILWLNENEDRKIVISTYTKTLQNQLYNKELPFLKKHLFPNITYALCLGSENYLCLRRLHQSRVEGLFELSERDAMAKVLSWSAETKEGLKSELDVEAALWQKVCRESDLCYGKRCKFYKECFYQKSKIIERNSEILIANHHLFFANIAADYFLLPKFTSVIFDEAHEIENAASSYLGIEISNYKLRNLSDSILNQKQKGLLVRLKTIKGSTYLRITSILTDLRQGSSTFFASLLYKLGSNVSMRIRQPFFIADTISEPLSELLHELKTIAKLKGIEDTFSNDAASINNDDDEQQIELKAIITRCSRLLNALDVILSQRLSDTVYFAEKDKRAIRLIASPLNISELLKRLVFEHYKSAILTSATLATNTDFDFIKTRLGLDNCEELLLKSPFNYKKQVLVYIPTDIPNPSDASYIENIRSKIAELLKLRVGKTMALFTNYKQMNDIAESLNIDIELLLQGEMDNYRLMERFKNAKEAALFGTRTFWQGVDFPGKLLQCLIITKLPFAVPTDPITEARIEYIQKRGGEPFNSFQVPEAVITLKQGFGRLIRTKSDTGVVAILDSRILKKSYGRIFFNSLPPIKITNKLKDILPFFNRKLKNETLENEKSTSNETTDN